MQLTIPKQKILKHFQYKCKGKKKRKQACKERKCNKYIQSNRQISQELNINKGKKHNLTKDIHKHNNKDHFLLKYRQTNTHRHRHRHNQIDT